MNFFTVIFQGFWSVIKTAVFWKQLFVTVYLSLWFLLLLGYSFFLFLGFSVFLLKRHYIGFFENTILCILVCVLPVWTCSLQTGGWERLPNILIKVIFFGRTSPPFTKLENMLDVIPGIIHIILKVFIKSMSVDIKSYSVAFYFPKYINVIVFPDTIWTN